MKKIIARARARNMLCIAIDRLNSDFLGAYGSSLLQTAAFDEFAAESVLFDNYFTTSLDLPTLYRAFWYGESPATVKPGSARDPERSLFHALKENGYRVYVISDVKSVVFSDLISDDDCDGRIFVESLPATSPRDDVEETAFFKNFEELAKLVTKVEKETRFDEPSPWFIWAHFSGWDEQWDFPVEARELLREDDDPEPYLDVAPPYWRRDKEGDSKGRPEESAEVARLNLLDEAERRQSVVEAYAGGIALFDETFAGFCDLLRERRVFDSALTALVGTRGCPLGAPGALGVSNDASASPFYAEEIRAPLAIRIPREIGATFRLPTLCEPRDLYATFKAWRDFAPTLNDENFWRLESLEASPLVAAWTTRFAPPEDRAQTLARLAALDPTTPGVNLLALLPTEDDPARDSCLAVRKDAESCERALLTKDWFLKKNPLPERDPDEVPLDPSKRFELFTAPDDRYCVNDVADRCDDETETLAAVLEKASRDERA